jgi:hypothetical protein
MAVIWKKQVETFDPKKGFLLSSGLLIIIWFSEFLLKYFLLQYGIIL